MQIFKHAIILAAGRGVRMMPLTKRIPKALVKIKDETLILGGIKKLKKFIQNIHITVGYKGSAIAEHVIVCIPALISSFLLCYFHQV